MINLTTQRRDRAHNLSTLYLVFGIFSLLVSWGIFLEFLLSGEASVSTFLQQAFATPIASLVSSDVVISALIFFVFAYTELKRLKTPSAPFPWLAIYVVGTFSVGVCFSLSLFLYRRERWMIESNTL
jgi:hypothetical protein